MDKVSIEALIDIFEAGDRFCDERGNHKIENPWQIDGVREIMEPELRRLEIDTSECFGDNFYRHNYEYFIHTDYREVDGESINVVVPLQKDPGDQYLVVFDQRWESDGRTWARDSKKVYTPNVGLPGRPCDYESVVGLTGQDIDDSLFAYMEGIAHMPRDYFFGLSGRAQKWEPGHIFYFNSKQLHCTAKMRTQWKLGLMLRFKVLF